MIRLPLRAVSGGDDFFAWDLEESYRENDFVCPICDDRLIPVIPEKDIIKHFRHKNNEEHKPESKAHLMGKRQIYDIIKEQHTNYDLSNTPNPVLEKKIGDKIADIYVPEKDLIIEYQCSSINTDEVNDRIANAHNNDIHLEWILGDKYLKPNRKNNNRITSAEIEMGMKSEDGEYYYPPLYFNESYPSLIKKNFKRKFRHGGGYCKKKGWFNIEQIYTNKKNMFSSIYFDLTGVHLYLDNLLINEKTYWNDEEDLTLGDFM